MLPGRGAPRPARRAGAIAFVILLAVYAATAAPDVTFWDAGEFLAAFHTLGIPHPPGTPLVVALGRAWELAFGWVGPARAAALLSGTCTAAAGAVTAALVARWCGSALAGVAAAVCAGATSTVWANATEAEAYAPALLLSVAAVACADRAGRAGSDRWLALAAYLLALAVPFHLSALVAAPAVVLLAATEASGRVDTGRALLAAGAAVAAAGAGRASAGVCVAGAAAIAAGAVVIGRHRGRHAAAGLAGRVAVAVAIGVSGALVLLVRARHDPAIDQGDPSTWAALADVLARRQYDVAAPWPRQAPWWIQLGNLFEWADWQFAYALGPGAAPSWPRTTMTVAYALLGVVGSAVHRRRDARSWRATAVLLAAGSVGVAAYLNLKAGPSFGRGVLPDDAPHEARERDYFFVLAWWVWGAWAALGAVALASRLAGRGPRRGRLAAAGALAVAALPLATNWATSTRHARPEARIPGALARALLASAPPGAVLLLGGDNDTYPLWYAQEVGGVRRDVTPVTVPLLGAAWYRRELARRHRLLDAAASDTWRGEGATVRAIAAAAADAGRPVAVSAAAPASLRSALGGEWALGGLAFHRDASARRAGAVPADATGLAFSLDSATARRVDAGLDAALFAPVREGGDGVAAWAQSLLRCPTLTLRAAERPGDRGRAASLDATCNRK